MQNLTWQASLTLASYGIFAALPVEPDAHYVFHTGLGLLLTGCRQLTAIAVLLQQMVTTHLALALVWVAGSGASDLDNASFLWHLVCYTTVQHEMTHFRLFAGLALIT